MFVGRGKLVYFVVVWILTVTLAYGLGSAQGNLDCIITQLDVIDGQLDPIEDQLWKGKYGN